jgi:hypothetical protein
VGTDLDGPAVGNEDDDRRRRAAAIARMREMVTEGRVDLDLIDEGDGDHRLGAEPPAGDAGYVSDTSAQTTLPGPT